MASETIQRPDSNITRRKALNTAFQKLNAPGTVNIFSGDTTTKINNNQPIFEAGYMLVFNKTGLAYTTTQTKELDVATLRRGNARFITVLGAGIFDGDFGGIGSFGFYGLDEKGNLPKMDTEAEIKDVATNLINGEAARMAVLGAVAMSNPAISVISGRLGIFIDSDNANSIAYDVLRNAQTALNGLDAMADNTILFIWNEAETKYGDQPKPTMRAYCKPWGVKYVRAGSPKIITGIVTDIATGLPVAGVTIYFDNGNNEATSAADGSFTLNTTLMDVQKLIATHPLYLDWNADETLVEGENLVVEIKMTIRP
ncbi:MAG: carboxypeptidase-like regulatory domain-containing protein [Bacteroidota bacterium]